MKIAYYRDGVDYMFSNEDIKVGDLVFPLVDGRIIDGEHYVCDIRLNRESNMTIKAITGFPDEPHTIIDLAHDPSYKPYEVRTDHGYGPVEGYFKLIKTRTRECIKNSIISTPRASNTSDSQESKLD